MSVILTGEQTKAGPDPLSAEHVVFALSRKEEELFFSSPGSEFFPGRPLTRLDPTRMEREEFCRRLEELQPTILVTAWSCPLLPKRWLTSSRCGLKYICSIVGSIRSRVPREVFEKGILVSNWGDLISHTVAEHGFLLVLACLRNLPLWEELVRAPRSIFEMMPLLQTRCLRGKRVGLHGLGAVARELARMLKPHQVRLSAWSQGVPRELYDQYEMRPCSGLEELFSSSDILIECEGLNERTYGSVTGELLHRLPAGAVFVNIGRGRLVADEILLAKMAREGRLRVGLDVFHHEPLPADSPLLNNPGVLLSPHIAGPTWDTYTLCGASALANIERFLRGEKPDHLVTPEVYERAT
jgi:phosphoglycerate dehydrogenase-like enzyme